MDEFSLAGPTRVVELHDTRVETYEVTPDDFGLKTVAFQRIASRATARENAQVIKQVIEGRYDTPEADFFSMNAAAALYLSGLAKNYAQGAEMARTALATGKAREKLEQLSQIQG